jgi:DNA phosphorothioation-dependent restriction protein DptG
VRFELAGPHRLGARTHVQCGKNLGGRAILLIAHKLLKISDKHKLSPALTQHISPYFVLFIYQARGPKKHLKRLNVPKHWMLSKMDGIWVRLRSILYRCAVLMHIHTMITFAC